MAIKESNVLKITPEEEEAIDSYQSNSSMINELLGNYISDEAIYSYARRSGEIIKPYYTSERIEIIMDDIQNIYSAMVKTALEFPNGRPYHLYRGSAHGMKEKTENSFISTTTVKNEALLFATSKDFYNKNITPCLTYVDVSGNLPYYIMPKKGNENEVLLSPFVEVKKKESYGGQWSGYNINIEDVELKKIELKEMSSSETEELHKNILQNAERIGMVINDYMKLSHEYNELSQSRKNYYNPELYAQISQKRKEIEEWKKSFRTLMEARCKEIEKKIEQDLKIEIEQEELRKAEEARKRKEERRIKEEQEKGNSVTIKSKIERTQKIVVDNFKKSLGLFEAAKQHGIKYNSPTNSVINSITSWEYKNDKADENTSKRIEQIMDTTIQNASKMSEELYNIEEQKIKKTIAERVIEIRLEQEMDLLHNNVANLENKKIGFIGKIFGKEKKREQEVKEMYDRIYNTRRTLNNLRDNGFSSNIVYSVHDIMAEMEVAKYIGGISADVLQEFDGYKGYINQIYETNYEKTIQKVKQKVNDLSEKREKSVIDYCEERLENNEIQKDKVTQVENFFNTINRTITDLNQTRNYERSFWDYNR